MVSGPVTTVATIGSTVVGAAVYGGLFDTLRAFVVGEAAKDRILDAADFGDLKEIAPAADAFLKATTASFRRTAGDVAA